MIAAERRKVGKDKLVADAYHGDAKRDFSEAAQEWTGWISGRVGQRTAIRYRSSLRRLHAFLTGKQLTDIDGRLIVEMVRERSREGVTNATIRRDLVALSSVLNFAIDQGWLESNPVLTRMRRIRERRLPIVLPRHSHIALVIERSPGMIGDIVRLAIATGARQRELITACHADIDHARRQMTIIGKRNQARVIDLGPFDGYQIVQGLRRSETSQFLFWHSNGASYKNFASHFSAIVRRAADWAKSQGIEFRSFRFHDLRHFHAVQWLKSGRSIYDLQKRLGHSSLKVTEMYLNFLTPEEERVAKGLA
jgi:integrase/recombinase XerD